MLSANKGKQRLLSTPVKFGGGQADGQSPSPSPDSSGMFFCVARFTFCSGTVLKPPPPPDGFAHTA